MFESVITCYGVGYVTEDKQTDTDEIMVYVPALYPEADGGLEATTEKKSVTSQSPTGDAHSSTGLSSNSIPAKWLPFNTNRITAPDVRKGSKVVIYKFKGSNEYRWMYFGMDGTLRLETVIYAWSASPKVSEDVPFDTDHYYIFLVSSHAGKFQLLTGQGNGEPAGFAITLDTKNGGYSMRDTEENVFSLDSMAHIWSFMNQEQSLIAMDKKTIVMSCEDTMLLKGKEHIGIQTKVLEIRADESITMDVGQQTNLLSPNILIRGKITHEGDTDQTGSTHSTGKIESDTDCISAGVSGKGHVHIEVKGGQDKSGLPDQ